MAQSGSITSQLSASLFSIQYTYAFVTSSATQLGRSGFYLPANTLNPTPQISFGVYPINTFTAPVLGEGDFWYESGSLKYFDGTNIKTVTAT